MSARAHPQPTPPSDNEAPDAAGAAGPSSPAVAGEHLTAGEIYELVEGKLSRRKLGTAEAHLDGCAECVETLAMVLRAERPASREEQRILAQTPEPSADEVLDELRPHIGEASRRQEWKTILVALVVAALLLGTGLFVRNTYWLPAVSRRTATDALNALVALRQSTGRIPLRYITEFERAGVVRSGFDTTEAEEQALIASLRRAVERAPEPQAVLVLGLLLLDAGELDEAERRLNRASEALPDSAGALNALAVLYHEKARREPENEYAHLQKGLAYLREAERIDPDDLRALYNYGKFYEALGMRGAAARAWTRYLEHDQASQWAEEAAYQLAQ